jgi:cell division protein FtsQ
MTIEPRLLERRKEVAEERARRTMGRVVKFMILLAALGALVWLFLSPLLSVERVSVTGVVSSSANDILVEQRVQPGTPMILIRADRIEADLMVDPWVAEATVELRWPHQVVVDIEERVPIAWTQSAAGWSTMAVDGVSLSSPSAQPGEDMPWIQLGGEGVDDPGVETARLGALRFVNTLPKRLLADTRVRQESDGELWATVNGFDVRLGRPIEMEAKALSLAALLDQRPPAGSVLNLIAPAHPAVASPGGSTSIDTTDGGTVDGGEGAEAGSTGDDLTTDGEPVDDSETGDGGIDVGP